MKSRLYTHREAQTAEVSAGPLAALADWITDYPMNEHAELGRSGTVCPFVKQASRLDTLRLAINLARPEDEDSVFTEIRGSFGDMKDIPAPRGKDRLRTIVVGFPNCAGDEGIAMLERIYKRHKYYTLLRSRMVAFFHPGAQTHGLWNDAFRSMRSPMPILAVRYLVEQDAVFAAKHKLMTLPYLLRFGPAGARRIAAHWQRKADTAPAEP
ncbi:MAG: hypothetical protein Q8R82_16165 [Hyphomonadaceae bacterium]|nr:hypothetical protein [Hyphomonadaceae bacterium]